MKLLIVLLLVTSCGKIKIGDSKQTLDVKDSKHRVDVVHGIDFESMDRFFRQGCEHTYRAVVDIREREDKVIECVNEYMDKAMDLILAQTNGANV